MTPEVEDRCVAALLRLKANLREEKASAHFDAHEWAAVEAESDQEALRIAAGHGIDGTRLRAYDSLARSRGVGLDVVLRAALRSDLRDVVILPARQRPASGPDAA